MTELRSVSAPDVHVPLEPGDRFFGETTILRHDLLGVSEVTVAHTGHELAESVVIGARFVSRWTLSPSSSGTGTDVTHTLDVEFPGGPFGRIERWVLRRRLAAIQRDSLANLAQRF
ncbi:MAG: hypothetical protein QOF60_3075 [Actinomycetota bacterium]|nr:hypothetical protein [Actinomycetota bacterium]